MRNITVDVSKAPATVTVGQSGHAAMHAEVVRALQAIGGVPEVLADLTDGAALAATVTTHTTDIAARATTAALTALTTTVTSQGTTLGTRAAQADLTSLATTVTAQGTAIATKAAASDVAANTAAIAANTAAIAQRVKTVNGTAPDGAGNVVVAAGGNVTAITAPLLVLAETDVVPANTPTGTLIARRVS